MNQSSGPPPGTLALSGILFGIRAMSRGSELMGLLLIGSAIILLICLLDDD
jgi:hypothetical protein